MSKKASIIDLIVLSGFIAVWYFPYPHWAWLIAALINLKLGLFSKDYRNASVGVFQRVLKIFGHIQISILLTIIYFTILTPISILYRLTRKKKIRNDSNWEDKNMTIEPAQLENMW